MRTLNLKGMSWIMALAMMFIVSFTSCSDDKEEAEPLPRYFRKNKPFPVMPAKQRYLPLTPI